MSQAIQFTVTCNDCGQAVQLTGQNSIGRPVYRCDDCQETQVGPFA